MADYSYLGSGKLYLREIGAAAGLLFVGNVSALNFAITEDTKTLKDYTAPGGGTYNEVRRIDAVEVSFSAHDLSPENLARALLGGYTSVVSAAVTDEVHIAYVDSFVSFNNLPNDVTPVVTAVNGDAAVARANTTAVSLGAYIKPAVSNGYFYRVKTAGTTAASPVALTTTVGADTTDGTAVLTNMGRIELTDDDFEFRAGGIYILPGAAVTDGQSLSIDYTKAGTDVVQALTNSAKEYELVFDGLNEARNGKRTKVTVYRMKAGALANLGLISDDYGVAEQTGKILKDTSKTGVGISQYFKVEIQQ
jgi:hypothetical protein